MGQLIAALDLPAGSRVDQRVPKIMLVENGAPTTADKRHINEGIEDVHWLAALKPTTIGVPEYRDDAREYLEIAVLSVTLRAKAGAGRLIELIHRAIPYPLLLIEVADEGPSISLAHKRWTQNEAGKVMLDGPLIQAYPPIENSTLAHASLAALALARQPRAHLFALYQGWIDTLTAWQVARLTGRFEAEVSPQHAELCRQALRDCQMLETRIVALRAQAQREKQLARRVALNTEMQACRRDLDARMQILRAESRHE